MNRIQRVEEVLKNYRASESSSVQDIETSYEKNARRTVQLKLHATFRIRNFEIKHGKLLEDPDVFKLLHKKRIYGEIDIYLGIVSPDTWKIADISPDFHIVDGKFEDCISSLNSQNSMSLYSPTTKEFPDEFNYYCIFEATTSHKATPKLKQLEYQIQYIVARHYVRQIEDLTLKDKSNDIIEFIKSNVLGIVCFCGLVMPADFQGIPILFNPLGMEAKISTFIKDDDEMPCLFALLSSKRLMYIKAETLSQRLEYIEEKLRGMITRGDAEVVERD